MSDTSATNRIPLHEINPLVAADLVDTANNVATVLETLTHLVTDAAPMDSFDSGLDFTLNLLATTLRLHTKNGRAPGYCLPEYVTLEPGPGPSFPEKDSFRESSQPRGQ